MTRTRIIEIPQSLDSLPEPFRFGAKVADPGAFHCNQNALLYHVVRDGGGPEADVVVHPRPDLALGLDIGLEELASDLREAWASTAWEPLTVLMISDLRTEAGARSDHDMVVICDRALNGEHLARAAVAKTITSKRAMDDSKPFVRVVAR